MDGSKPMRQRWVTGAVVKVALGEGVCGFGQLLKFPEYAFFDLRALDDVQATDVVSRPVLFRIWVMKSAHSTGRWPKIGVAKVSDALSRTVYRFNQDPIDPTKIRLTKDGTDGPLVSVAECHGLERAAVWDAQHVEDRLRDQFAGRPNKWAESMKIRA